MYDVVGDLLAREASVLEFIWGKRGEGCSGTGQSSGSVLHSDPACSSCAGPPFWSIDDLHFEEVELNPPAVLYSHTLSALKKNDYTQRPVHGSLCDVIIGEKPQTGIHFDKRVCAYMS